LPNQLRLGRLRSRKIGYATRPRTALTFDGRQVSVRIFEGEFIIDSLFMDTLQQSGTGEPRPLITSLLR
jgi:hypothetical protein